MICSLPPHRFKAGRLFLSIVVLCLLAADARGVDGGKAGVSAEQNDDAGSPEAQPKQVPAELAPDGGNTGASSDGPPLPGGASFDAGDRSSGEIGNSPPPVPRPPAAAAKTENTPQAPAETNPRTLQEHETRPAPKELTPGEATPADGAPTNAARETDADNHAALDVQVASFAGMTPGLSTRVELEEAWGPPKSDASRDGIELLTYQLDPFGQTQVKVVDGVVDSITVHMGQAHAPDELAERLHLDELRPVEVADAEGRPLGRAYPERGVLFSYLPGAQQPTVAQLLLEPIDVQSFVLRAASHRSGSYTANLADLEYAIEQSPDYADALALKSLLLLELGRPAEALKTIEAALEHAPATAAYRFTKARCLAEQGAFGKASEQVKSAISGGETTQLDKAQASLLLATFALEGPERDYQQATELYLKALELADPLSQDRALATRRAAKYIRLDAHLGVARCIGWGNWKRKDQVVPRWVDRAEVLARDLIENESASPEVRLQVIEAALRAHSGFQPAVDPARFVEAAQSIAAELEKDAQDPLRRQRIDWQVGLILSHAVSLAHSRDDPQAGLQLGKLAAERLQSGVRSRTSSLRARYELGRAFFRIGALQAVHEQNHEQAVAWYGRATPLLMPRGGQPVFFPGEVGESLVSMGVSYWEADLKQKALETTSSGAKLIKTAVDRGTLARTSLVIPYNNLASMHQQLGDSVQAKTYAEMATRSEASVQR